MRNDWASDVRQQLVLLLAAAARREPALLRRGKPMQLEIARPSASVTITFRYRN